MKTDLFRRFTDDAHVIVTPYSTVLLSPESLAKLDDIDGEWRDVIFNKRRWRGKRWKETQAFIKEVENAAEAAWTAGGTLEVY